jgi:plastocyanin
VLAVVVTGILAAAALTASPAPAGAADIVIRILPTGMDPASVTVAPGTAVTWVNNAGADRWIAADDGAFDSGSIGPNETFQFVFTAERTVAYHLTGEAGQTGTIVVSASAAPTTPAPQAVAGDPFTGTATPTPAAADPNLASTGSAESANGILGGVLLAGGVALTLWAARRRLSLAWLGSPLGRHDDLLPRGARRRARDLSLRHAPRRSRHRV